jgi:hypothetical protein
LHPWRNYVSRLKISGRQWAMAYVSWPDVFTP